MASAERSVGVRSGGAGRWFSSLASFDFTAHLMLFAGAPKFPLGNARARARFQYRKAAFGVMIRIRYIMEYLGVGPFHGRFCSKAQGKSAGRSRPRRAQ